MLTFLVSAIALLVVLGYARFWLRVVVGVIAALIWGTSAAPSGQPSPPSALPPYAR